MPRGGRKQGRRVEEEERIFLFQLIAERFGRTDLWDETSALFSKDGRLVKGHTTFIVFCENRTIIQVLCQKIHIHAVFLHLFYKFLPCKNTGAFWGA